jgi:oxygen-independent coproporphyrinogen-3 oxidase
MSVYVHWPWCVQKCPYCDFNSHVAKHADAADYAQALEQDWLHQLPAFQGRKIHSVFFGGGTPSLAHPHFINALLNLMNQTVGFESGAEITLEANPGTVDAQYFADYFAAGVNRLSLGVQSFNDGLLQSIGRIHDSDQAKRAIELAYQVGFRRINMDLMVGLPGQTEDQALSDIHQALSFEPEHLSHYQLTLEPNTPFFARPPRDLPDADRADQLQVLCHQSLQAAGWQQYEVSAWHAADGRASQHNLNYWQFGDYVGIGAGAHGKITRDDGCIWRTQHAKAPVRYQQEVAQGQLPQTTMVLAEDLPFEFFMNGLRLKQGVAKILFLERTGLDPAFVQETWHQGVMQGLLSEQVDRYVTTELGYRFLNRSVSLFL